MLAKCPYCNEVLDTAKLVQEPFSQAPVDHTTKRPIDVTTETHVISGSPLIDETTVRNSDGTTFEVAPNTDPRTGLYTKDPTPLGKDVTVTTAPAIAVTTVDPHATDGIMSVPDAAFLTNPTVVEQRPARVQGETDAAYNTRVNTVVEKPVVEQTPTNLSSFNKPVEKEVIK